MAPILRSTVATASVAMTLLGFSHSSPAIQTNSNSNRNSNSNSNNNINNNNSITRTPQRRRRTSEYQQPRQKMTRNFGDGYVPPWRDHGSGNENGNEIDPGIVVVPSPTFTPTTLPPTPSPTLPPTIPPTLPPTIPPTLPPTPYPTITPVTSAPTTAPVAVVSTPSPTTPTVTLTLTVAPTVYGVKNRLTPAPVAAGLESGDGGSGTGSGIGIGIGMGDSLNDFDDIDVDGEGQGQVDTETDTDSDISSDINSVSDNGTDSNADINGKNDNSDNNDLDTDNDTDIAEDPIELDDLVETTVDPDTGATETACKLMPSIGNFQTEVLDIEYSLYVAVNGDTDNDSNSDNSDDDSDDEQGRVQTLVQNAVEPQLHQSLVELGMGCRTADFLGDKHYSMVDLSSSGLDFVGERCPVDGNEAVVWFNDDADGNGNENELSNGTNTQTEASLSSSSSSSSTPGVSCYLVWGRVEATMWFANNRRLSSLGGGGVGSGSSSTPFGDREAFLQFTDWMEQALGSLGTPDANTGADTGADIPGARTGFLWKTEFHGYSNVQDLDGTPFASFDGTGIGVDHAAAFMGTAYSVDRDPGFNKLMGTLALIAGGLVLILAMVVVVARRRRTRKAVKEHARCVEDMRLESGEDLPTEPRVVDDESLFGEEDPLPENYRLRVEDAHHDYRTCANPSCKLCRKEAASLPVFVATDTRKRFDHHLSVLRDAHDEELSARNYESVML